MATTVHVTRVITVQYEVPIENYPGMSRDEIVAWESDGENIGFEYLVDQIVGEEVTVAFVDKET